MAHAMESRDPTASATTTAMEVAANRGHTYISDDVVSVIARLSAEQVEGIHQIGESNLRTLFGRGGRHHGVDAEVGMKEAAVDLEIIVEFGYPIREVAQSLRREVIESVERMTGRRVVEVDVNVVDVHIPGDDRKRRRQLD